LYDCTNNKRFGEGSPSCVEYMRTHLDNDKITDWFNAEKKDYWEIVRRFKDFRRVYYQLNDSQFWLEAPDDCQAFMVID
jgi:hypothetical protein